MINKTVLFVLIPFLSKHSNTKTFCNNILEILKWLPFLNHQSFQETGSDHCTCAKMIQEEGIRWQHCTVLFVFCPNIWTTLDKQFCPKNLWVATKKISCNPEMSNGPISACELVGCTPQVPRTPQVPKGPDRKPHK